MSEEEKKAIENLKKLPAILEIKHIGNSKDIDIVLNLINKQQKEIEELKSIASKFINRNIEQFSIGEFNFKVKHFKNDYISKDKIRAKIKELRKREDEITKLDYTAEPEKAIDVILLRIADLEELLEEN